MSVVSVSAVWPAAHSSAGRGRRGLRRGGLLLHGFMHGGYEDGTVRPENDITRAEVAAIFFRLLTDTSRETFWSQVNGYSDVAGDSWYNIPISTMTSAGVLAGYEDGTYRPTPPSPGRSSRL